MANPQEIQNIIDRLQNLDDLLGQRTLDCNQLTTAVEILNAQRAIVDPVAKSSLNTTRQFRGRITDDWTKWLSDFNKTANACRWNNPRKVEILPSLLTDHAEKVYNQTLLTLNLNQRDDWDAVTEALNLAFNTADALRMKASQFHQCRQLIGESSEVFADRLQDMYEQAYPTIPAADRGRMLLDAFINNLTPTLKTAVLCSNPNDLNAAVAVARRFEVQGLSSPLNMSTLFATVPSVASLIGASSMSPKKEEMSKQEASDKKIDQLVELVQQLQREIRGNHAGNSNQNNNRNFGNNQYRRTRTFDSRPICFLCDRVGHVQANCRSRGNNDNNPNFQNMNLVPRNNNNSYDQNTPHWSQEYNRNTNYNQPNTGYNPNLNPLNQQRPPQNPTNTRLTNNNQPSVNALMQNVSHFSQEYDQGNLYAQAEAYDTWQSWEDQESELKPEDYQFLGCIMAMDCGHSQKDFSSMIDSCDEDTLCSTCCGKLEPSALHVNCERCNKTKCTVCEHRDSLCTKCTILGYDDYDTEEQTLPADDAAWNKLLNPEETPVDSNEEKHPKEERNKRQTTRHRRASLSPPRKERQTNSKEFIRSKTPGPSSAKTSERTSFKPLGNNRSENSWDQRNRDRSDAPSLRRDPPYESDYKRLQKEVKEGQKQQSQLQREVDDLKVTEDRRATKFQALQRSHDTINNKLESITHQLPSMRAMINDPYRTAHPPKQWEKKMEQIAHREIKKRDMAQRKFIRNLASKVFTIDTRLLRQEASTAKHGNALKTVTFASKNKNATVRKTIAANTPNASLQEDETSKNMDIIQNMANDTEEGERHSTTSESLFDMTSPTSTSTFGGFNQLLFFLCFLCLTRPTFSDSPKRKFPEPMICQTSSGTLWTIPETPNCKFDDSKLNEDVNLAMIKVYKYNEIQYRAEGFQCHKVKEKLSIMTYFLGDIHLRKRHKTKLPTTVQECHLMMQSHQCSAGDMVDKGGLLQTQNNLDPDPPGGGIYCCRYEDYEIEHCYAHKVPVFKRHGETQMTSPTGSVRHCEYTAGACVLEGKTTLIWKPNSDKHCEFLPWRIVKGSAYGNHIVANSLTLGPQLTHRSVNKVLYQRKSPHSVSSGNPV